MSVGAIVMDRLAGTGGSDEKGALRRDDGMTSSQIVSSYIIHTTCVRVHV